MSDRSAYYQEFEPHTMLRPFVACYWVSRYSHHQEMTFRILPDACMDIIFNFTGNDDPLFLVGTSTTYTDKTLKGTSDYFGIRFRPGGLYAFTRQPMQVFTDGKAHLADVSSSLFRLLAEAVKPEMQDEARIRKAEDALLKLLAVQALKPVHRSVLFSITHIGSSGGGISVPALAAHACTGERQLQRLYMEIIGVSPKTLCNITRYIRTSQYIKTHPGHGIEDVAHENGYFDRSHLFREFRRFSGQGPLRPMEL